MKTSFKHGALAGLVTFLWVLLEYIIGFHTNYNIYQYHPYFTNFIFLFVIILLVRSIKRERKTNNGKLSFKQGFGAGIQFTIALSIVAAVLEVVYFIINPSFTETMVEFTERMVREKGGTEGEVMQMIEQSKVWFAKWSYVLQVSFGYLVIGTITSLITSAIVKRK